jgi:excisionase family DNA binding protein
MSTSVETEYATPEEVARALRISKATAYRWCQEGRLTAMQVGGRNGKWLVPMPIRLPQDWRAR